jgi:hypothetical protein
MEKDSRGVGGKADNCVAIKRQRGSKLDYIDTGTLMGMECSLNKVTDISYALSCNFLNNGSIFGYVIDDIANVCANNCVITCTCE